MRSRISLIGVVQISGSISLITNYELKELGIDSKYFNLHITIDNFDNGHAQLATNAIKCLAKRYPNQSEFIRIGLTHYYL